MEKFRLLTGDEIECRVKKITDKGAIVLLYKTARTDMDMLDETAGPENWTCDYREIKDNLYCGIAIFGGEKWVWKWDCGIESREDGEGNEKKGEASDAFKRAGFKWGIGRELYTAPFIFISADKMNISGGKTFDTFDVDKIEYDDKRRVSSLTIRNNKTGKIAYSWKSSDKPSEPVHTYESMKFICADCGKTLAPHRNSDGKEIGVREIADKSHAAYGKTLCAACVMKRAKADASK